MEKNFKWCDYHKSNNIYSFPLNPIKKNKIIFLYSQIYRMVSFKRAVWRETRLVLRSRVLVGNPLERAGTSLKSWKISTSLETTAVRVTWENSRQETLCSITETSISKKEQMPFFSKKGRFPARNCSLSPSQWFSKYSTRQNSLKFC